MRPWTTAEEQALRELCGFGLEACSLWLDRPTKSVEHKAYRLGLSLKVSRHDPAVICGGSLGVSLIARVKASVDASLCPSCGKRPVGVKSTGLCGVCHRRHLKSAHDEELAEIQAQRDLWAARKQLQRAREQIGASS